MPCQQGLFHRITYSYSRSDPLTSSLITHHVKNKHGGKGGTRSSLHTPSCCTQYPSRSNIKHDINDQQGLFRRSFTTSLKHTYNGGLVLGIQTRTHCKYVARSEHNDSFVGPAFPSPSSLPRGFSIRVTATVANLDCAVYRLRGRLKPSLRRYL